MRNLACVVLSALFLPGCGAAPLSLSGRVVDQKGSPISRAEVGSEPETDFVMTNDRGFFNLKQRLNEQNEPEAIPPGKYRVKVRKSGFDDLMVEVDLEEGPTKVPDLVLQPRTPEINETAPDPTAEQERDADEGSTPVPGI